MARHVHKSLSTSSQHIYTWESGFSAARTRDALTRKSIHMQQQARRPHESAVNFGFQGSHGFYFEHIKLDRAPICILSCYPASSEFLMFKVIKIFYLVEYFGEI